MVTKSSRYTLDETVGRLEKIIHTKGLVIFSLIDHSAEAARVGLKMHEAKLIIFGSPKAGTPLMIASPLIALDLPLKVLVWKDDKGGVWVSYNSVSYLANRYYLSSDLTKNVAGIDALIESTVSD